MPKTTDLSSSVNAGDIVTRSRRGGRDVRKNTKDPKQLPKVRGLIIFYSIANEKYFFHGRITAYETISNAKGQE